MSTSYFGATESPLLIARHVPNVKLLVSLRNPVDALYSHYYHISSLYRFPSTFEEFIRQTPRFLAYYRYAANLSHFLKFFPPSRLHSIVFDDIIDRPEQVLTEVYRFLGVQHILPSTLDAASNEKSTVRSRSLHFLLSSAKRILDKNVVTRRAYRWMQLEELGSFLRKVNTTSGVRPPMLDETRHFLLNLYRGEIDDLSVLIDRDLTHWYHSGLDVEVSKQ